MHISFARSIESICRSKPGETLRIGLKNRCNKVSREAVRMEPYREAGYRRLMQMLVKNGERGEAVRAYLECKRLLEAELGVGPSEETEGVYREIAGLGV